MSRIKVDTANWELQWVRLQNKLADERWIYALSAVDMLAQVFSLLMYINDVGNHIGIDGLVFQAFRRQSQHVVYDFKHKWETNPNLSESDAQTWNTLAEVESVLYIREFIAKLGTLCTAEEFWSERVSELFNPYIQYWEAEIQPVRAKFMAEIAPGIHASAVK